MTCMKCHTPPVEGNFKHVVVVDNLVYKVYRCATCQLDVWVNTGTKFTPLTARRGD